MQKPSIPKGTRDFSPEEMAKRNYIFNTIREVYHLYGFQQIETPAMENLSTLMGKYGEEGDKLLFKILNSGDCFAGMTSEELAEMNPAKFAAKACEKGLRYDLTVPFARFVVQHRNEISFPFKRYQIQPVWRADRPQKGRYREFYQCDVDMVGSRSQLCELELVQIVDEVYRKLGIRVILKINNRKVLSGLAEISGCPDKVTDITVAIDKIDKIGLDAVKEELLSKGLEEAAVEKLVPVLTLEGSNHDKLAAMRSLMASSEEGMKGLDELEELFGYISAAGIRTETELDLSLARGLSYYTGAIFEVKALDWQIGSIGGGGRYDNLTGIFGLPGLSGVGISFGADRIYDVMKGLNLFPAGLGNVPVLLFANMGSAEVEYILPLAAALRAEDMIVEIYPDAAKLDGAAHAAFIETIESLVELHKAHWNGIWCMILFDRIAAGCIRDVDLVAGNPPWVKWSHLPRSYAEFIKPLCDQMRIFSEDSWVGGIQSDISTVVTYRALARYVRKGGALAFLITGTVFKNESSQGFRRWQLVTPEGVESVCVDGVEDYAALRPFEGVANSPTLLLIRRNGEATTYPVRYRRYRVAAKMQGGKTQSGGKLGRFDDLYAMPVPGTDAGPWLVGKKSELRVWKRLFNDNDPTVLLKPHLTARNTTSSVSQ